MEYVELKLHKQLQFLRLVQSPRQNFCINNKASEASGTFL